MSFDGDRDLELESVAVPFVSREACPSLGGMGFSLVIEEKYSNSSWCMPKSENPRRDSVFGKRSDRKGGVNGCWTSLEILGEFFGYVGLGSAVNRWVASSEKLGDGESTAAESIIE